MNPILAVLLLIPIVYLLPGFVFTVYIFRLDLDLRRLELPSEKRSSFTFLDHVLEEEPKSQFASILFFVFLFLFTWISWVGRETWEVALDLREELRRKS